MSPYCTRNLLIWLMSVTALIETFAELYVGSICNMTDNSEGYCKGIRSCEWALNGFRQGTIRYDQLTRCTFDKSEEIICCPDKRPPVTSTVSPSSQNDGGMTLKDLDNDRIIFEDTLQPRNYTQTDDQFIIELRTPDVKNNKIDRACFEYTRLSSPYIQYNIINGIPTGLGEFPHMAAIGTRNENGSSEYSFNCGGTLISETFVLTAAHCTKVEPSIVRLGKISLYNDADEVNPQDIAVARIINHPRYKSTMHYDDIALLRLERAVVFDYNVRPACIYTKAADLDITVELIVTGWGAMSSGGPTSSILLKTDVATVPLEQCNSSFVNYDTKNRRLPNGLAETQLCASNPNQNDACQGDSGGPLQIKHSNGMSTIVGVLSFGVFCGTKIPSVHTRVAEYLDWIENIVWS